MKYRLCMNDKSGRMWFRKIGNALPVGCTVFMPHAGDPKITSVDYWVEFDEMVMTVGEEDVDAQQLRQWGFVPEKEMPLRTP